GYFQGETSCRQEIEVGVVVETRRRKEGGAGAHFRDAGIGGGTGEAAAAATVDEAQLGAGGAQRLDDVAAAAQDVALGDPLETANHAAAQPLARIGVGQAGDLGFVAHDAIQEYMPAAAYRLPDFHGFVGAAYRRASRPEPQPRQRQRHVDVQAKRQAHPGRAGQHVETLHVFDAVDHQRDPAALGDRPADFGYRWRIHGRIGNQQIVEALVGEPGRYAGVKAEQPLESRAGLLDAPEQGGAAHGFGADPDRLVAGVPQYRLHVRVERFQADDCRRQGV